MAPDERDGWAGYRLLILNQLKSFEDAVSGLRADLRDMRENELQNMRVEIALLKLKSGIWGAVVGSLSAILVTLGAILLRIIH